MRSLRKPLKMIKEIMMNDADSEKEMVRLMIEAERARARIGSVHDDMIRVLPDPRTLGSSSKDIRVAFEALTMALEECAMRASDYATATARVRDFVAASLSGVDQLLRDKGA